MSLQTSSWRCGHPCIDGLRSGKGRDVRDCLANWQEAATQVCYMQRGMTHPCRSKLGGRLKALGNLSLLITPSMRVCVFGAKWNGFLFTIKPLVVSHTRFKNPLVRPFRMVCDIGSKNRLSNLHHTLSSHTDDLCSVAKHLPHRQWPKTRAMLFGRSDYRTGIPVMTLTGRR